MFAGRLKRPYTLRKYLYGSILMLAILLAFDLGVYIGGQAQSQSSTIELERGSFQIDASYVIFQDGSIIKARDSWGNIKFSGTDAVSVINNAISDTQPGGSVVIKESDSTITLRDLISITKDVSFYSYAKLKIADAFNTSIAIYVRSHNTELYIYELDGNKANNLGRSINGIGIVGAENLRMFVHTKNFGFTDVSFWAWGNDDPNKNIALTINSENNGGIGLLNSVVHFNEYNDNIFVEGYACNVGGARGQVIYSYAHGLVSVRNFKMVNATAAPAVIDFRNNTKGFIESVEIDGTGANGIDIYPNSTLQVNNLRISGVPSDKYAIQNFGRLLGSNLRIDSGYNCIYTRGGQDWASVTNLFFSNAVNYAIRVKDDSAGKHLFDGGKITGPYGMYDMAAADRKSIFRNIDVSEVTGTKQTGAWLTDCLGYRTKNSGLAYYSGTSTVFSVLHGLDVMPNVVIITPKQSGQGKYWVLNIYSTSFEIAFDTAPSPSTWYFYWYAEYKP